MTEILGQTILDQIVDQNFPLASFPAEKYSQAVADTLEGNFDLNKINRSEVKINGGVENDGQTISLELAPYPLPLRYINEYKKLIHADQQIEVFSYLIFESNKISRSKLKIVQLPDLKDLNSQIQNFYEIEKNWKAPEEDDDKAVEKDKKTSTKK
ncbi:conserved hypothetical protein [Oenococcus oeni]|nr:hypothetical protein [Oenococcus oeni]SYW08611.1 conserved hypothetical protein [Oenococcus oeni]